MFCKKLAALCGLMVCFFNVTAHAAESLDSKYVDSKYMDNKFKYPFYIGVSNGYGSTTWGGLIPSTITPALALSTPSTVGEGGYVWGAVAGIELMPVFGIEAAYAHYPTATINFSKKSLFAFQNHGMTSFRTNTSTVSFSGKLMVIIPRTTIRLFSTVGIAGVHRGDMLKTCWNADPTFGVGLNYNFTSHWMGEFGANYTGGYGESELTPASDYIPFLYSVFARIAFRF